MSKPFFVLNVVEGRPSGLYERPDLATAIDLAVELAVEQCDVTEDEAREVFSAECSYIDSEIEIAIMQTHEGLLAEEQEWEEGNAK